MARRTTAIVALVGALAVVGGCTPHDEPTDPPTSTSSSSTEETTEPETIAVETPPEVEAPTPAPEASTDDHIGVIWSARYFLDLYTYMGTTGDVAQFQAMSGEDCEFCASSIADVEELHGSGGWVEGGALVTEIADATADYPTDDRPYYTVVMSVIEEPSVIHGGDGTDDELSGSSFDATFAIQFVNGRFIVYGVSTA